MATLRVGPKYLSEGASNNIEVYEGDTVQFQVEGLGHLYDPGSRLLKRFAIDIDTVEVGFCDIADLNFLEYLPGTTSVWVLTSVVKDISGLRHASQLQQLVIDRPTCRMDVLGVLASLSSLHLDDWRPGAASLFNLTQLETVGIRRYPYSDLRPIQTWTKLNHLWLAYGGLESLDGIPDRVTILELAELRRLRDIDPIRNCQSLERLIVQGCSSLSSLAGLEACHALRVLSVYNIKSLITNLEPVRDLPNLTYLFLTELAGLLEYDETILDNMSQLETLIISKKLGIPIERLLRVLPNTDIRMAR